MKKFIAGLIVGSIIGSVFATLSILRRIILSDDAAPLLKDFIQAKVERFLYGERRPSTIRSPFSSNYKNYKNVGTREGLTRSQARVRFAKQLLKRCPVCEAGPGDLCNSNGVWIHADRFKVTADYYDN